MIAFSGYVGLLSKPVSAISNLISTALNGVAGGRRVFSIIDEEPIVQDAPDATEYEFKGGHIQCTDVDFSYVLGRKILRHNTLGPYVPIFVRRRPSHGCGQDCQ